MPELRQLHDDLWVLERDQRFLGLEVGTRMTVVRFGRDLLLHSPVTPDDALRAELEALGRVRWVVGPNRFHHLYLGPWADDGAKIWGAHVLKAKRPDLEFEGTLGSAVPWPDELEAHATTCIPFTGEAVFFHQPSSTLIVSDLLFNIAPTAPWLTRAVMWAGLGYPGVCCTLLERCLIHRAEARTDLERMVQWGAERVVLAHGDVIEEGGTEALVGAYRWVG